VIESPVESTAKHQLTAVNKDESSSNHFVLEDDQEIANLACINNELFVIRYPALQEIQVYETATYRRRRTMPVAGLRDLSSEHFWNRYGLAACISSNSVYVCDGKNVFKVDIATDDCVLKWQVDGSPSGLFVNAANNVMVTCNLSQQVVEYTSDGSRVRDIKLPPLVETPFHAVQLTSGEFVVSHTGNVHDVSLLDPRGQLVTSYRYSPGARTQLLNRVRCLAVDSNGRRFVVDSGNNRIVICNSSFSCKNEIPVRLIDDRGNNIWNTEPRCLALDESRGRLYVGVYGKRICVYSTSSLKIEVNSNIRNCS